MYFSWSFILIANIQSNKQNISNHCQVQTIGLRDSRHLLKMIKKEKYNFDLRTAFTIQLQNGLTL